jgi:hypothetical protein
MLSAHPLVLTPDNETHLYDELYHPIVAGGLGVIARQSLLAQHDARPLGDDVGVHLLVTRDDLARLLERAEASGRPHAEAAQDVIAAVLDRFAAVSGATGDTVLVEKTPSNLFHAQRILRRFPEARIVEVLRDGRDVCVSMQYRAAVTAWAPRNREEQIRLWVEAVRFGMTVRSAPETAGRWHVFQFEAAKRDPRHAITELFTFCGLPFDGALVDRVVEATDFSRMGDGEMFRRGAVGDWKTHFDDADRALFARLAGETLTLAGYQL